VVQYGSRAKPVKREIPSAAFRAGSSLRLKNGYAQDDALVQESEPHALGAATNLNLRLGSELSAVFAAALNNQTTSG
jgi:hypothetical protein